MSRKPHVGLFSVNLEMKLRITFLRSARCGKRIDFEDLCGGLKRLLRLKEIKLDFSG